MAIDKFYLEKLFPEAGKVFSHTYKTFDEIKDSCIYVLDTNILFVPFLASKNSLSNFEKIFSNLKQNNKLFLPERVAREFAHNRGSSIAHIFRTANETIERINKANLNFGHFPILEEIEEYKKAKEFQDSINSSLESYKQILEDIGEKINGWTWDDPVSKIYKEIFTNDILVKLKADTEEVERDLEFRLSHNIPPGYTDNKKIDKGIGDLVIWQTIIELAKDKNTDVTLVSNEKKNDWFYTEYRKNLFPKYELFDEFRRKTDGKSVSIINFEDFLISQEATEDTINEVKDIVAPSGYRIITKDEFLKNLSYCSEQADYRDGFISSKFFIETYLANSGYDIGNSWEMFNRLVDENVIEKYTYHDPNGIYPPLNAVKIKEI